MNERRADRDLALLARPELRAVRLLLEYLKPELAFTDRGIRHTVVVFGSTHLLDPEAAARRLADAERAAAAQPAHPALAAGLRRARTGLELSRYYASARELGALVGRSAAGPAGERLVIVTGGGPGAMEAANRGARDVGAPSVGLNINLPEEQEPNPYIAPGLSFSFRYFAIRKLHFMLRARALVAFPGGYGTLDEVFETLCLIATGKRSALPVVLVGEAFWRRAIDFDFLLDQGVIGPPERALFRTAETAPEIWDAILGWYAERGRTVFEDAPVDGGESPA